ncbi:MAG: sporulation protein YqfD [Lachnospiraceae bacterium]|nr:sporulation protein YqfD [Lachnospiraceae bacterium]
MPDILKYIKGYLRIRVSGFSPERFMNLCSNKDILLWDIVREKDSYCMCVSLQSFYRLKAVVKKTRTKVVILERKGLPFLLPFVQKRSVFVCGLVFAIAFLYLSGYFVWDIEIEGNLRVTTDQMVSFLAENEIREGMWQRNLNIEELEKQIRRTFPVVTWTSAKLDGTKLVISLKENDAPIFNRENEIKEEMGSNLITEYDGTIVSIVVRNGIPLVKAGDEVTQGTMLVDGRVPVYNEDGTLRQFLFRDADADIVIEHNRWFEKELSYDYIERTYTGREKKQYFLRIGNTTECKLPVERPFLQYDRIMRSSRPVLFEKLRIPVFWGSYTYREYQNVEHLYAEEAAQQLLEKELSQFLQTLEQKGVQIIEKDVKIENEEEGFVLRGNFTVQEKAGRRVETDKGEDDAHDISDNE